MQNLGLFDQFFYKADQYNVVHAIMGGASVLTPHKKGVRLKAEAIAGHLAARLGNIALLRSKFVQDPLRLGSVKKIEDPDFDIWEHIFVESLPAPGGYEELRHRLAELSSEPLQLSQMWRWTVIEGLAGGKLAVMCNIHHAVADGVGMVEALSSMYDATPVKPEKYRQQVSSAAAEPTALGLLGRAVVESSNRLFVKTPQFLRKNTGPVLGALGSELKERLTGESSSPMPDVQMTSLNTGGSAGQRAVSWKTFSLPELKILAKHFGGTVNDVGLLLYSYAMQHYFECIGEDIHFDLWCGVPLSTRSQGSAEGGNQVTMGRVCLHNTLDDPITRLHAIHRDAEEMKQLARPEAPVLDMEELGDVVQPLLIDASLYITGKLNLMGLVGGKIAMANALFSNVPGPRQPVYVANAVMTESIPMIPAVDILAVSGGITSVDKSITIGFHCNGDAVSDPQLFVEGLEHGLKLLKKRHTAETKRTPGGPKSKPRKSATGEHRK